MTQPVDAPPAPGSARRRAGPRTRRARLLTAAVAATLAATLSGCDRGLCPARAFEVDILVRLAEEWAATGDVLVTVGCPASAECGFLHGPVTDDAVPFTTISTVLRPEEVYVQVTDAATGREVAHHVLPVEYVPTGRQNHCGSGPTSAGVTVPYDPLEAPGTAAAGTAVPP